MRARHYQVEALDGNSLFPGVFPAWETGARSVLMVKATGTGKTVTAAMIIQRIQPKRTMFIAHRQELIWQARDKIQKVTGLTVDVEMGDHRARVDQHDMFRPKAQVIVSTVQTHVAGGDGAGRIGKFDPADFGLLIFDEAHHAVSQSYKRIQQYYMSNPDLLVLGLTATPDRTDEKALGQVFDQTAFVYEIEDAIDDGFLVPVDQEFITVETMDLSKVRTTAGDLNGADLDAVMRAEKNLWPIAKGTLDLIGDESGIGFASSVEHARMLANIFNFRHRAGMAGFISAKTDKEERKKIISDFSCGKIQFLWNCGVLTEGFDASIVKWISMGRPTKSRQLYAQMVGRGTRPADSIAHTLNNFGSSVVRRALIKRSSKDCCRVIDFVGNSGKHKLIHLGDVLGGRYDEESVKRAINFAKTAGKPVRMLNQIKVEEEQLEREREEAKRREAAQEARKSHIMPSVKIHRKKVDPFDVLDIKPVRARGWDEGKEFSEPQRRILREKLGLNPDEIEYARGKQMIGIWFDRIRNKKSSIGQCELLEKLGFTKTEATRMSYKQASATIDICKQNRWKRPANFEAPRQDNEKAAEVNGHAGEEVEDNVPF